MAVRTDRPAAADVEPGALGLDALPVGVVVADRHGCASTVNVAWAALSGLTVDGSLGNGWLTALTPTDRQDVRRHVERVASGVATSGGDYRIANDTTSRWLRFRFQHRMEPGAESSVVVAVTDVSEDRAHEADLAHRATHDALTGLMNRDMGMAFIDRALRRLDRHPRTVAVIFVDLDDFKCVNDLAGHHAGDLVLIAAASRLRGAVRPADVVARIGGDEFVVVCDDLVSDGDIVPVVERIRAAFSTPFDAAGTSWAVGASVGVAVADGTSTSPEVLVDAADRAMYQTKPYRRKVLPGSLTCDHRGPGQPPAMCEIAAATSAVRDLSRHIAHLATIEGDVRRSTTHLLGAAHAMFQALTALEHVQHPPTTPTGETSTPASAEPLGLGEPPRRNGGDPA